jgi:Zn-dependent M28 family amino/carboxypeptidase
LDGVFITIKTPFKTQVVKSCNVLGYLEGSDPELKKEVVVIGAHLDHLGKQGDYIYNGACDNGSGCAAVLELAQAFAVNPVKPKRSVLFALWTGEERGMLGSRFYVGHPYFPAAKTAAYLNMDVIGWEWEDKETLTRLFQRGGYEIPAEIFKKIDLANFLMPSLARESAELYEIIKNCGRYLGLTLFLRKSAGMVGGSDFVPFARENIPWTHIAAGGSNHTHQPGDSIDKINFHMIRKVAQFIYTVAFTLSDK